jgi:hypothetical protein
VFTNSKGVDNYHRNAEVSPSPVALRIADPPSDPQDRSLIDYDANDVDIQKNGD